MNNSEAYKLIGERAARLIAGMGAKNVLVKGGHAVGDALDILFDGANFYRFSAERIHTKKQKHGTISTKLSTYWK